MLHGTSAVVFFSTLVSGSAPDASWATEMEAPADDLAGIDGLLENGLARAPDRFTPVIVTFSSAAICGPSARLRRDIEGEAVRRALGQMPVVHVTLDTAQSWSLAARYKVQRPPTLVALTPAGAELSREVGYDNPRRLLTWLVALPSRSYRLTEAVARARTSSKNGALQLGAALRLIETGAERSSWPFLLRASRDTDENIAVPAIQMLGRLGPRFGSSWSPTRAAEAIASRFPASTEAVSAEDLLMSKVSPRRAAMARVIHSYVAQEHLDGRRLDRLLWFAYRLGLAPEAERLFETVSARATKDGYVATLYAAEHAHMTGNTPRAVHLLERASEFGDSTLSRALLGWLRRRYEQLPREPAPLPLLDILREDPNRLIYVETRGRPNSSK